MHTEENPRQENVIGQITKLLEEELLEETLFFRLFFAEVVTHEYCLMDQRVPLESKIYLNRLYKGPTPIFQRQSTCRPCKPTSRRLNIFVQIVFCQSRYMDKNINIGAGAAVGSNQNSGSSSYAAAIDAISSLITKRRRADGSNKGDNFNLMYEYLKILDLEEPLSQLRIIHVAGTKGKGSTCAFVESILRTLGFRTGLYTSPHLIDVFERYRLDGLEVSEETFLTHFWWCWDRLKDNCTVDVPMPPYFRFLTLLAFKIFTAEKVDVAILEVGLGGKFDATNVVKAPVVCGISSLGFDHMEILGNTLAQIAGEKAGIFKLGVPAITVPQPEEAMTVLKDKASQLGISLQVASPLDSSRLGGLKLGLAGDHQNINAGLAVALCRSWLLRTGQSEDFNLSESVIEEGCLPDPFIKGLATANIPGRAQVIPDLYARHHKQHNTEEAGNADSGELIFYLDGAHSPESMEACAKWFSYAIREDSQSHAQAKQGVSNEIQKGYRDLSPNSDNQHNSTENPGKHSKQILLFNCMSVRDPQLLLPQLVNTCSLHGVHFHRALFVPSQSSYTHVGSSLISADPDHTQLDLSWQLLLQRTWENMICGGRGTECNHKTGLCFPQMPPPCEFLLGDSSNRSCPDNKDHPLSAVMPSLPMTIKWLRECAQQKHSVRLQVLVTGSLHLIGDVLRMLKK